jgi:hypothetical protein
MRVRAAKINKTSQNNSDHSQNKSLHSAELCALLAAQLHEKNSPSRTLSRFLFRFLCDLRTRGTFLRLCFLVLRKTKKNEKRYRQTFSPVLCSLSSQRQFRQNRQIQKMSSTVQTQVVYPVPSVINPPAQIQVSAEKWRKWREMHAKASAMEKEAKALRAEMGFPETAQLVQMLGVTETEKNSAVIIDGNGTPLGKVSVFYVSEKIIPAQFQSRIS